MNQTQGIMQIDTNYSHAEVWFDKVGVSEGSVGPPFGSSPDGLIAAMSDPYPNGGFVPAPSRVST
jgi:hypothetical protein